MLIKRPFIGCLHADVQTHHNSKTNGIRIHRRGLCEDYVSRITVRKKDKAALTVPGDCDGNPSFASPALFLMPTVPANAATVTGFVWFGRTNRPSQPK